MEEQLRMKYNPEGSDLRKAQLRMIEMLAFIDKVCKDYDITYWIDSGTLLGARRHGGFIPWDDDADICMTWQDAKKFKKVMLNNKLSDEFVIQCRQTDKGFFGCWFVLRDLKSEYIQNSDIHKKREYRGLQVDVFPTEIRSIPLLFTMANIIQNWFIDKPLYHIKKISIAKIIVLPSYYILHALIPLFRAISPKRDFIRMSYGTNWKTRQVKNTFPIDSTIKFENLKLMCPYNVDGYLSDIYGDWQKLPSEIMTHNVQFIFHN